LKVPPVIAPDWNEGCQPGAVAALLEMKRFVALFLDLIAAALGSSRAAVSFCRAHEAAFLCDS
jgi:hypothetical protein